MAANYEENIRILLTYLVHRMETYDMSNPVMRSRVNQDQENYTLILQKNYDQLIQNLATRAFDAEEHVMRLEKEIAELKKPAIMRQQIISVMEDSLKTRPPEFMNLTLMQMLETLFKGVTAETFHKPVRQIMEDYIGKPPQPQQPLPSLLLPMPPPPSLPKQRQILNPEDEEHISQHLAKLPQSTVWTRKGQELQESQQIWSSGYLKGYNPLAAPFEPIHK